IKQKCFEGGIEKALERDRGSRIYEKKVDGDLEAHIIQLACSKPPEGFARWTLRMLADKIVELKYADNFRMKKFFQHLNLIVRLEYG
ncbi:MAG: hypothetical protein LBB53_03235, partial [Prevotellaceae bacterium]|nr:hypothetical protein [Prevotellaceae bacterium]